MKVKEEVVTSQTARKASQPAKALKVSTPTRTDMVSTDTRFLDNRPSESMAAKGEPLNWLKNDRGPQLRIEAKQKE